MSDIPAFKHAKFGAKVFMHCSRLPAEVVTLYSLAPLLLIAASILSYKHGLMDVINLTKMKAATDGVTTLRCL